MFVDKTLLPKSFVNKSLLPLHTVKGMTASKEKENKEIARLLDELEKEDLFELAFSEDEVQNTAKGAGHKYIRKYKANGRTVYVYPNKGNRHTKGHLVSHSRAVGKDEHIQEGSAFAIGKDLGHMHIENVSGDKVTYTIDGKGKQTTVTRAEFKKKVMEAHRPAIEAHAKAGMERREDILRRATAVDPNSKHTARAKKEIERWKAEAKDFLLDDTQKSEPAFPKGRGVSANRGRILLAREYETLGDMTQAAFESYSYTRQGLILAYLKQMERQGYYMRSVLGGLEKSFDNHPLKPRFSMWESASLEGEEVTVIEIGSDPHEGFDRKYLVRKPDEFRSDAKYVNENRLSKTRKALRTKKSLLPTLSTPSQPKGAVGASSTQAELPQVDLVPESTRKAMHKLDDRCVLDGLKVSIENDAGSTRRGTDPDGKAWSTTMKSPYGYIRGTKGVDGDHLDVFLGPEAQKVRKGEEGDLSTVYIVHANDVETGEYDEDKCMLGYTSKAEAVEDFRRHYDKPERFLGPVSEMSWEEFKANIADTRENPRRLAKGEMFDGEETRKACGYKPTKKAEGDAPEVPVVEAPDVVTEDESEDTAKAMSADQEELDSLADETSKALSSCYEQTQKAQGGKYSHIDFTPPESVQNAAERGLEMRAAATPSNRGGLTTAEAGKQGIGSGVARASQLKRGSNVSPKVIGQMVRFFSSHSAYKHKHKSEPQGKARQSWLLWGGDAGEAWANKVKRQMEAADKDGGE